MKSNRIAYVIAASTLALIALIAFQVKWMADSRSLIEEQFDQKVRMALCFAVENADVKTVSCKEAPQGCTPVAPQVCAPFTQTLTGFTMESTSPFDMNSLDSALADAFTFYDIPLTYRMQVQEKSSFALGNFPAYTCSLAPLENGENHVMMINFPDKGKYIFGKMKFMFFTSILILLFITSIFIFTNYTLLRQKRMTKINREFFNNMAHEFRTPLTNITLAGNLLSKKTNELSQQKYIEVVKDESKKLTAQVERVLHLAKLENGEYQLEKENLCPSELIQTVIESMDIQIKEKNAVVHFETDGNVSLEGDRFHLGNAFRNLLDNALKYSGQSPEIKISLEKDVNGVLFQFQDNGIGIGKNDQKGVFEKFRRINNQNIHNQKGFGLGLAYVKMIVERHQGFIKIFSEMNKGTRFDLFLPTGKN